MKIWTLVWQQGMVALLGFALLLNSTACGSLATILADVQKYEPLVLNVFTLACALTPAAPECAAGEQAFSAAWTAFLAALTAYEAALKAGTETAAAYDALNALLITFEDQSQAILNLAHVFNPATQQASLALVIAAQTLLAVIEAQFPGPPATATVAVQMTARPHRFAQHLPQQKINNAWARQFFGDYNRNVKALRKIYPQAPLQTVPGVGFWSSLGKGLGEWKFGG